MLAPGSPAPDFTLPDDTGSPTRLATLLARGPVVLMFYPGDNTPLCTKEACMVRDTFSNLQAAGVTVVGISRQGTASKAKFRSDHNLRHVMLADESGAVAKMYKASGIFGLPLPIGTLRVTYLIDPGSVIRDAVHSEFSLAPHEALLRRAMAAK
jgi:thioredoxin-dependent peroxiredoxin